MPPPQLVAPASAVPAGGRAFLLTFRTTVPAAAPASSLSTHTSTSPAPVAASPISRGFFWQFAARPPPEAQRPAASPSPGLAPRPSNAADPAQFRYSVDVEMGRVEAAYPPGLMSAVALFAGSFAVAAAGSPSTPAAAPVLPEWLRRGGGRVGLWIGSLLFASLTAPPLPAAAASAGIPVGAAVLEIQVRHVRRG